MEKKNIKIFNYFNYNLFVIPIIAILIRSYCISILYIDFAKKKKFSQLSIFFNIVDDNLK